MSYFFFSKLSVAEVAAIDEGDYYGTLAGANEYFSEMLFEAAWTRATGDDRVVALVEATRAIDRLNYKGAKHPVYLLDSPTRDQVIVADGTQGLEFPRGPATAVPLAIEEACYEIAYALLAGADPEDQSAGVGVVAQTYGAVRTSYGVSGASDERAVSGIPSSEAWTLLKPYLVRGNYRPRV